MSQEEREHLKEVDSLSPETGKDSDWVNEKLARDKQRKKQRSCLFLCILILCAILYGFFLFYMSTPEKLAFLANASQYSLLLVSLLGLIPTALILSLMRSVYRSTKEGMGISGMAGEIAKFVSIVAKHLGK